MNIAYIVEMYRHNPHGGIAVWTRRLAEYYATLGIKSRIYAYSDGIPTKIPDFIKLIPNIRELLVYPYIGWRYTPDIEKNHDIIHYASPLTAAWRRAAIPSIMSTHYIFSRQSDILGQMLPAKYKLFFNPVTFHSFKHFEKKGFQNADMITVCRLAFKEHLINKMDIPEERIVIVQYGIDNAKFKPNPKVKSKEPMALYVGRGSLPKGFDTFIEAAKSVKGKMVAIASQVPPYLAEIAKSLENVEIKTGISEAELVKAYQQATVFVMPSLSEGAPVSTLEAISSGLPVVCTPEGSGDYIEDGVNGYIFDFKNANQLAERVNYLFDQPALAAEIGDRNREKVNNELTLPIVANKILDVYKKF